MIHVVIPMILTHLDNQPRDGVQRLSSRLVKVFETTSSLRYTYVAGSTLDLVLINFKQSDT